MQQPILVGEGDSDDEQEAPWPLDFFSQLGLTGTAPNCARVLLRYRRFIGIPDAQPLQAQHLTDEPMAAFVNWYCRDFGLSNLPSNTRSRSKSVIGALQTTLRRLDMPTFYNGGHHYPEFMNAVHEMRLLDPNPW
ncbi:hypothetical protein B484DRAFT_404418 [Ochromonadaceae sp. CCMP2298]|nr:hypothetical protein B484DRAFT_404418 [Ochromonadaceae sp. CCMP2298]